MPNWKKVVTSGSNVELNNIDSSGYIDITGASSDPGVDGVVRLGQSSNALRIYTNSGYTQVGPANSGFSHFYTDRAKYYFNKNIVVDEGLVSSYNEDLILRRIYSSTANQITIGDDSYELTLDSTVRHSIDGVGNNTFTGNISASGFVSASSFAGDGSGLTNVSATATPAGSDTQVQFNNGGSLGASSDLTFATDTLTATKIAAYSLTGKLTAGSTEIEGSNFDINGGTIDGITSLTAGGNLDIGSHTFRAHTLQADNEGLILGGLDSDGILLKNHTQTALSIGQADDDSVVYMDVSADEVSISTRLDLTGTTDATNASGDTGVLRVEGGASIAKKVFVGTDLSVGNHITASGNISSSGTLIANGGTFTGNVSFGDNNITNVGIIDVDKIQGDAANNVAIELGTGGITFGVEDGDTIDINEGDHNADTQIRSENVNPMVYVDASADKVGIGTSTPQKTLTVAGEISASGDLILGNLDTGTYVSASAAGGLEVSGSGRGQLQVDYRLFDTGSSHLGSAGGGVGDIIKFGGSSTTAGDVYYLQPAGTWAQARANAVGTSTGSLAVALGTNSTTDGMLLRGMVKLDSDPSATIGNPVYLDDTTAGHARNTAPDTQNDVVRIVGHYYGNSGLIYFNPDNTFIEIA